MVLHHCPTYPKVTASSSCYCFFVLILSAWENRPRLCLVKESQWVVFGYWDSWYKKRSFAILRLPLHPLLVMRFKVYIYFPVSFSTTKQRNGGFCIRFLNLVHIFCFHVWFISIGTHSPYLFSAISHVLCLWSVLFNLSSVVLGFFLLILGTWGCELSSDQSCMINLTFKFHWELKLLGTHWWFSCLVLLPTLKRQKSNK